MPAVLLVFVTYRCRITGLPTSYGFITIAPEETTR